MTKILVILMMSVSGAFAQAQNDKEIIITVPEGRVSIKGDIATFMGGPGFGMSQEKIESRKGDIVKVYWRADRVSRCYNLKAKSLVNC